MTLTKKQTEFLLTFFENKMYAGWRTIAMKLLETGQCIVAGEKSIWIGGIGNFIKTAETELAVDCLLYTFNLPEFIKSEYFKSISNQYIAILISNLRELETEYNEISKL